MTDRPKICVPESSSSSSSCSTALSFTEAAKKDDKLYIPLDEGYQPKILKAEAEGIVKNVSVREFSRQISGTDAGSWQHQNDPWYKLRDRSPLLGKIRERESRVLVLYTGGTIGMRLKDGVYVPEADYLPKAIRELPPLHDKTYAETFFGRSSDVFSFCLPAVKNLDRRIIYFVLEYEPLLDSSDMTFDDWSRIAKDIYNVYNNYDGFVVLHGTDTLAYTASAMSFMLENLGKPVVFTGAQIPVAEVRSDGRENLIGALIIAGAYDIPEVTIYFNDKLFRGNRATKANNSALDAFDSPNIPVLAHMEINIKVKYEAIFRSPTVKPMSLQSNFRRTVSLLRIFPSMTIDAVRGCLQGMDGVVLQSFGAGNMPSHRKDIIQELKEAVDKGVVIVNVSQCHRGCIDKLYFSGKILYDIGVISGADMTPEAALTKLAYVLGKDEWGLEKKREMMQENLRGELTVLKSETSLKDVVLLRRLASFLGADTTEQLSSLHAALLPPLLCSAAGQGHVDVLKHLKENGALLTATDYGGKTALHVAASTGQLQAIEYLLEFGVSVHVRDHRNENPLQKATKHGHTEAVRMLRGAGAALHMSWMAQGVELCLLAAAGLEDRLRCWVEAGANINAADYDGRTALHVAVSHGRLEAVKMLLENGADREAKDAFGQTPFQFLLSQPELYPQLTDFYHNLC